MNDQYQHDSDGLDHFAGCRPLKKDKSEIDTTEGDSDVVEPVNDSINLAESKLVA